MSELHNLESLQALHADLLALSESRLSNVERLGMQLEAHIQDFKALLDKKGRNDESRKSLATGKLDIDGGYNVNSEFQEGAQNLANTLDLDELEAARIFLEAQSESEATGRSLLTCSIVRFHQRRKVLLDCIRLMFELAGDVNRDEIQRDGLLQFIDLVVQPPSVPKTPNEPSGYLRKCLSSMVDIKSIHQTLVDKPNIASVTGGHVLETTEYQRVSLVKQHELLGVIVFYLVKRNYTVTADFEAVLETLKKLNKFDAFLVHYFPAIAAYIARCGGQEGGVSIADARALNEKIFSSQALSQEGKDPWALPYVHAAFRVWWLAEYSSWYGEHYDGSLPQNQLEEESRQRSKQFSDALKDGAFECMLSLSADVKSSDWDDPARHGLRQFLQRKVPPLNSNSTIFSDFFQELLMDQFESFIEGFITNLPDVLRKLRIDEDEQRQLSNKHDHDADLELFILIISYTFEGRPKAALEGFWDVPDGALIGFMHWASRRASTPLVSAFCEMLQAISEDEECANAAHQFLLDEGPQSSGKMRRTHSLTWNQIFKELTFFSSKLRDRPSIPQNYGPAKLNNDHAEMEPESSIMLESYLRLIGRICTGSAEARQFLGQHPSFHLTELLFQLVSSSIQPRLKACAFVTLRSLLNQKTKEAGEYMWAALDVWISGGYSSGSNLPKASASVSLSVSAFSADRILRGLSNGFEEPNALVQLLHALVLPYAEESGLNDGLPFPENLGASSRMPGIEPYIDFAIGQVFGTQAFELESSAQTEVLQLTCLNFIATCLDTFNEDLVIFANRSNIIVDNAIQASNLQSYVLLHPFSRVMEWMFNERIMKALFAAVHQDLEDVGRAAPDSPLILRLLRAINVLISILELQATYLDIVRPLIKLQSNHRRIPVSSAAFVTFEDGILNHLTIISDLGLYCGAGHPELVIASLRLLEKLSASPRLASPPTGRPLNRNKIIAALEANNDAEAVSRALLQEMISEIDVNQGPASSTYIIKLHILDFLSTCLKAAPSQPTIAHLLLGFKCYHDTIDIDPNSPFNDNISLFHTILDMVLEIPTGDEPAMISSWLVALKFKGLKVLHQLWQAPLSSHLVMKEMRASQSLFIMLNNRDLIEPGMLWDGKPPMDQDFLISPAASCLSEFLSQRSLVLQYVSAELRLLSRLHKPSLKKRVFGTLLGSTTAEDGEQVENPSIFDLFDFAELELNQPGNLPQLVWFQEIDLHVCLDVQGDSVAVYDLTKVRELLLLRRAELVKERMLGNPQDANTVDAQTEEFIQSCFAENQIKLFWESRLNLLRSWVQLVLLMVETGDFEGPDKTSFILRALRTILPSLENKLEDGGESMELARLARALVFKLEFDSESFSQGDMGDLVTDRLFHLFQVSLRAINSLGANPALKELFYSISYRYLTGMSDVSGISGIVRRHSTQTIKAAGERFIEVVCDDAHAGEPMCRISALLLLSALVKMGKHDKSKYTIDALVRLNFIGIIVESVQYMATDLRETAPEDVGLQLQYCHAKLALLFQISQVRFGATAVINAGFFHAVKMSGLFAKDPDLDVDIDDKDAVQKHYELLAAIMRVICATVISRGSQNEQTIDQGRRFLTDNRSSILSTFKKSRGLGTGNDDSTGKIKELADSYVLLISVTDFVDNEETTPVRPATKAFT